MAPSVNSDTDVKASDSSSTESPQWLDALVQAIASGKKSENDGDSTTDETAETTSSEETEASGLSADEIRDKYDIPDFTENGLTETEVDETNDDGEKKTVGEKAAEDFIQGIRDDVDSGKLDKDSDEAKLVDLIDAQGAVDNGYDLYGYVELMESGGSTYRQSQTDPTHLTSDDAKALIDEDELASQISELMQSDDISKRYDESLQGAIESIPDDQRSAISDKVNEALFDSDGNANLDFEDYVIAIKEKAEKSGDEALGDRIQTEVDNYFQALQALDPDRYAARKQTFDQNMMTHQLDSYMENPDSVDDESADVALRDTIDIVQHGINGALQEMDKGTKAYNAYNKVLNDIESFKKTLDGLSSGDSKKLLKAFTLATNISESSGADQAQKEKLFQNVINDNLQGVSEDTRGSFKKVLDSASGSGTLGAMTGTMSLISGGVQLSNGSWDDMTDTERLAAVRDLVSGLSFGNDFARFGSNIVEQLGGKGKDGKAKINATSWLGLLDDNFPDIWKSQGTKNVDAVSKSIKDAVNTASDNLGDAGIPLDDLDEQGKKDYREMTQSLGEQMGAPTGADSKGETARKMGRSFLRFMGGAGLDVTGGVMDIVTGVKKLQNADTALEKAGAGLTLGAGTSGTAMSIANTISMFSSRGSNLAASIGNIGTKVMNGLFMGSRIAGPVLGIAGAIFGIAGSLIAEAINHQKMQKLTDSQGDFFKDLASYGVTQDDWGDKLEFARYESYMYGGRDSPDDQSIFEYQADEWEHFQNTDGERGSSLPRLAPNLHVDGDPDSENLWEKHLDGTTVRQNGKDSYYKTDDWRPWSDTDTEILDPADESGLPRFGDDSDPGTYSDFKEDVDRVDVGSIELAGDDRVIFSKDGVKQIIDLNAGDSHTDKETRGKIIDYLKGLYDLSHPNGEFSQSRADEMNDVFAQTDSYNDVDAITQYIDAPDPAAWDENPDVVNIFGDSGDPGNFGDFKEDMDKVDVASIRLLDGGDTIYFKKSGTWYVLTPNANSEIKGEFEDFTGYLKELYDITHTDGVLDKRRAAQIDELFGRNDDYNDLDDLKSFLNIA
ncbi:hypothetical protein [Salinicola rhizosphaerae]|uniref:Uncharacterized protein n=1 Tax=Salinicola rhizosphaerae TaxID=1443141 RepID=A0ABQ3DUI4_9GAMM|nr:hypothetical protein [Salinicola rhizosphaerae]GHB16906.1 hypothetical protein GCM10009038_14450 [Salinicola rhizosphaerae]